jgi:hypothetical protein
MQRQADPSASTELRCPVGPQKLLAQVLSSGERPQYVHPDNLIELACNDCARTARRAGDPVARVLHRFNILGELVETLVVHGPPA